MEARDERRAEVEEGPPVDREKFFDHLRLYREEWDIYVAEEGKEKTRRDFRNHIAWGVYNDVLKPDEITAYPDGELIE